MGWPEETIGQCRLILGDCREVLPTMPPVDAVLTDIPYGIGMKAFDDDLYIGIEGLNLCQASRGITWVSPGKIAEFVKASAWHLRRVLWMEKVADLSYPWRGWIMNSEAILVLEREPASQWPVPESYHRDCYAVGPWPKTGHPNSKPLWIVKDLIQKLTAPGQCLIDPFLGSGTTGVAAAILGRQCIGIESNARWFDIACRRIAEAYAQPDLFVSTATKPQQLSLGVL